MKLANVDALRQLLTSAVGTFVDEADYRIVQQLGKGYLATDRDGVPAYLVPLSEYSNRLGRMGGGLSLNPAPDVRFSFAGKQWRQPSAVLTCTDRQLISSFLALVVDLQDRLDTRVEVVSWAELITWLDEWQALLLRENALSAEAELGLWGELWLMSESDDCNLLFSAWRGPDDDPVDFFLSGIGVEVKISRRAYVHHVSLSQVRRPVGVHEGFLLSMWAAPDPSNGTSLAQLIDSLQGRISDPPALLRRLSKVGYTPKHHGSYHTRYALLERPMWFSSDDVPKVRQIDPGIAQVRYVVTLDPNRSCDDQSSKALWDKIGHRPLQETPTAKP
jgi:hypothetical protein